MSISAILKNRRKELGLTLLDVANKVGVSESAVQRWESGNIKNLRHGRIVALAEALKVSPSYLMGWTDNIISPDSTQSLSDSISSRLINSEKPLQQISDESGLTCSFIKELSSGEIHEYAPDELSQLAKALNAPISGLLGTTKIIKVSEAENEMLIKFRALNEASQSTISALIDIEYDKINK